MKHKSKQQGDHIIRFTPQGAQDFFEAQEIIIALEDIFQVEKADFYEKLAGSQHARALRTLIDLGELQEFDVHASPSSKSEREINHIERLCNISIPHDSLATEDFDRGDIKELEDKGWITSEHIREKEVEIFMEVINGLGLEVNHDRLDKLFDLEKEQFDILITGNICKLDRANKRIKELKGMGEPENKNQIYAAKMLRDEILNDMVMNLLRTVGVIITIKPFQEDN